MEKDDTWKKLRLLVWKHFHLKRNRWILSLIEIFLPILIVYFMSSNAGSIMKDEGITPENATVIPSQRVNEFYKGTNVLSIVYYTPNTESTKNLLNRTFMLLDNQKTKLLPLEHESLLVDVLSKSQDNNGMLGVVFDKVNEDGSQYLTYRVRDVNVWFTDTLFYNDEKGPVKSDNYKLRHVAALQLAINEAFLQLTMNNSKFDYNKLMLQPFPYPEYNKENPERANVPYVVCVVVLLTVVIISTPLITAIIEEKESGVKELMKIVGLQEWLIWLGWFLHAFIFSFFSFTVVTYLLQHEFSGPKSAAMRSVDPSVLWCYIMLYCISNIAFCFTFTAIFHHTSIAASVFYLVLILIYYESIYAFEWSSLFLVRVSCLFPVSAFVQGFNRMRYFEIHDMHLGWSNLNSIERNSISVSLGFVFMMLIFDSVLYFFLAYYIGAINPGKFGAAKSPFFIFEETMKKYIGIKQKRLKKKLQDDGNGTKMRELINKDDMADDRFFEKTPANLEPTIEIKDLYKNFGYAPVVNGVNLNIYPGEILALLGHNGAGKTTTLGILTGLLKPTDGFIRAGNLDVLREMDQFRRTLGVCPQEDRLFPYLSVKNHLLFFGMLKGRSSAEALEEATKYMKDMEIIDKADNFLSDLSGGMKRKLCLSIALMGNAKILILDEPTSGLDVQSRRKLWDLLLNMRGERTIILTTHHMEEADALGNRIAIMHHGALVCYGSSLFLKKCYETGYKVTIIKRPNALADNITKVLTSDKSLDITLETSNGTELVYVLPLTETSKFPDLFRKLETKAKELGVENVGISCTTMEQVFLKVGGFSVFNSENNQSRKNNTVPDGPAESGDDRMKPKTGISLIIQQIVALMLKKFLYMTRNWLTFMFRVLIPSLVIFFVVQANSAVNHSEKPLSLSLETYPNAKVMIQNSSQCISGPCSNFIKYLQKYSDEVISSENNTILEGLIQYGRENLASFQREVLLAAAFFDNGSQVLLYNRFAIHSLPVLINSYANSFLVEHNSNGSINMINHPINVQEETCSADVNRLRQEIIWFFVLVFFTLDMNAYFMIGLNVERLDGFKHIQLMSNLSPITYWASTLIFDAAVFFVIIFIRIIGMKLFDQEGFLSVDYHFAVLLFILVLFIVSSLLFTYVLSYLSNSKSNSYFLLLLLNSLGVCVVIILYFLQKLINNELGWTGFWAAVYIAVRYVVLLVPPLNYSLLFIKFFNTWFTNDNCVRCMKNKNCQSFDYFTFSSTNQDGIMEEILFLLFDIVLYFTLLVVIQLGYLEKMMNWLAIRIFNRPSDAPVIAGNPDVESERQEVNRIIEGDAVLQKRILRGLSRSVDLRDGGNDQERRPLRGVRYEGNALITHQLKKKFVKMFRPFTAVDDVNFAVKASECFGLLGVNGAGKSTTFRMLTADLLPTEGDSSINGYWLSCKKNDYLSRAGYCSQSNCFLSELSGREMLTLIAKLRGITSRQVNATVDKWLNVLGLAEYQNQRCGDYSGGNKRKLCTAMSLIGDPQVVFLDEPTSGVDPVARRKLYEVMDQSKASGQAVILTSHSMDECENLCDRITILVKGRMQCIGTVQHLKKSFAQGFSVLIKLADSADEETLARLKNNMQNEFRGECMLKDEHKTQLYYQITDIHIPWSVLFEKMENIRMSNEMAVEDYSLSDTSLEEVFISFAKMGETELSYNRTDYNSH